MPESAALTVSAETGRKLIGDARPALTRERPGAGPQRQLMTHLIRALSLGCAGLIAAVQPALAQASPAGPACADRRVVIDTLSQNYGETRRSIGLAANDTVMELYASAETGSWTIAVTLPDGRTCLMASGQGFEPVAENLPALGDPA